MRALLERRESGAVAVLFALLAVVVIGVGALAVDLGNAFARKRISQTQADLAALAGAAELPNDSAAIDEAFDYLVKNVTPNQGDVSTYKAQMTNGNQDDGEIWVESSERVNVLTPPAQVDYALGGVFQQYGVDVQAYGQAGVFSPGKVAPFFVPYGCSTPLPSQIFVKSGSESTPTDPVPTFLTPMQAKNGDPSVDTITPVQVAFGPAVNSRSVSDAEMEATDTTLVSVAAAITSDEVSSGVSVIVEDAMFAPTGADRAATGDLTGAVLTSADAAFTVADVGSKVVVDGAGLAGAPRFTVIESFQSDTQVTLAVPAAVAVVGADVTITPGTLSGLETDVVAYGDASTVELAGAPDLDVETGALTVTVTSTVEVEITGDGFRSDDPGDLAMEVAFVRGTTYHYVEVAGEDVEIERYLNPKRDAIDVFVPVEVVSQSNSRWYIQVRIINDDGTRGDWSFAEDKQNAAILEVSASADPGDQCGERVTGDFGLLNSPRADVNQLQARLDLNIAEGFDHGVQEFPGSTPLPVDILAKDNCRVTPQTPVAGGILDDEATVNGGGIPNCLEINNGNKVDATTDGLVTGGTNPRVFDGRLDAGTSALCSRDPRNALGTNINDDVLSCYLQSGSLQGAISGSDPKFIGEIVGSPRFMFVPVLWAAVNPQNGFYPIERFVGAFITEQNITTVAGDITSNNEPVNGVPVGPQKVQGITVIPFELNRLPTQIAYDGAVIPYIGSGPKVVRLLK